MGLRRYRHREPARAGQLYPALPAPETDSHVHQRVEFLVVEAVIAVTDDRLVDGVGGHDGQRFRSGLKVGLESWRIEQPEGDVKVLAEGTVSVVMHVPRVDDRTQAHDTWLLGERDAAVARYEQPGQG